MDAIDQAILDAINNLNPAQLQERARRARSRTIPRPARPFCICLRASDTRLDSGDVFIAPKRAIENALPHDLFLTSENLQHLSAPVHIPWPGLDWTHAAYLLGRHPESLRHWIARGRFQLARYNARALGKRGCPVPFIWSSSPLDPNADTASAPDALWGTLWQSHHKRIPENLEFQLRRLPCLRDDPRGSASGLGRFRGWRFICPGLDPHGPCGGTVARLYFPLSPPTIFNTFPQLAAHFAPPARDAPFPFTPACHHCHRIRYSSVIDRNCWNQFLHLITDGLLFGTDVPMPASVNRTRKRAFTPHPHKSPQRDRVRTLLLTNLTQQQIATRLGVKLCTIYAHAKRIYRDTGVHSRVELKRKHGTHHPINEPVAA